MSVHRESPNRCLAAHREHALRRNTVATTVGDGQHSTAFYELNPGQLTARARCSRAISASISYISCSAVWSRLVAAAQSRRDLAMEAGGAAEPALPPLCRVDDGLDARARGDGHGDCGSTPICQVEHRPRGARAGGGVDERKSSIAVE